MVRNQGRFFSVINPFDGSKITDLPELNQIETKADIDAAARDSAALKFLNSEQVCVNINRFFAHESVYDEFTEKFISCIRKLTIGSGVDSKTNFGHLLNKMGLEKVENLGSDAVQ